MREPVFKENAVFEAVFGQAVIENYERELKELEKEPDIAVSDRHRRRMETLFAKERRDKRAAAIALWSKRLAATAAALFIVTGGLLLTVPSVRASALEAFAVFFDGYARFGADDAGTLDAGAADWRPTFIPDGFSETSESNPGAITVIRYANADGNTVEFLYTTSDNAIFSNYENVNYGQTLLDGIVYHTFSAESGEQKSAVVWDADGYIFNVAAYMPVERLLEIAQSVGRE
jgi:hypothetical protein